MAVRKLTTSTIENNVWYKSMLAGNPAFIPSAYDILATTLIESNTELITFSGLSAYASSYTHLQLRYSLRTGASGTTAVALLRFNFSETGYARHRLTGDGSSVTSNADGVNQSQMSLGFVAGASTGGTYAGGIVDILDAFKTTKFKTVKSYSGIAATNGSLGLHSGLWQNTSAISSINLISPIAGEFLAVNGSRVSLYGVKA